MMGLQWNGQGHAVPTHLAMAPRPFKPGDGTRRRESASVLSMAWQEQAADTPAPGVAGTLAVSYLSHLLQMFELIRSGERLA